MKRSKEEGECVCVCVGGGPHLRSNDRQCSSHQTAAPVFQGFRCVCVASQQPCWTRLCPGGRGAGAPAARLAQTLDCTPEDEEVFILRCAIERLCEPGS
jgi:hypothetical protein